MKDFFAKALDIYELVCVNVFETAVDFPKTAGIIFLALAAAGWLV